MSEHHSVREALKLLSTAELVVFRCKCDGKSLGEIANALGIKTQVAKLLLANMYDKLGITFLDNRKRQMRLTEFAMMLRVAIHEGSFPLPSSNDLSGTPAPEMPPHRALAEVQNDERDRLWPVIPLDMPPDEHAHWSTSRNSRSQHSDQHSADDASTDRQRKNSESTASAQKGRSYRQSGSTKDDLTRTSRQSPVMIGGVGLGCILTAAAGLTATFAGLILLNITFETLSNDEADAAIGTYTEPRDRNDEISVPNPTSTPMPSTTRPSTPVPTPTQFPSRTIPGELVHTSDGTLFQSWLLGEGWKYESGMIVHDGTSGPSPVLSVPYSGRHASVAVELDLRIDGDIHPTGPKSLGVYLRMNDDSAYRMSLAGQTTIEYAEASLQ